MNPSIHPLPFPASEVVTPARLKWLVRLKAALRSLLVVWLLHTLPAFAQNTWTGAAGTTNWSSPGNWTFGASPTASDSVLFDNTYPAAPAATVDNIVDGNFTITGFNYSTVSTNGYHTTLIPAGRALNINGAGGDAIFVGTGLSQGSGQNAYSRFVGPGTMAVTNTAGVMRIMLWGANNDHRATLDLSGLTNFAADLDQVLISTTTTTGEQYMMGTLLLAETNFLRTAADLSQPGILIGSMNNGSTGKRGTQQLFLGQENTIHSDVIVVGGFKMDGAMQFRTGLTGGVAVVRGSAGGSDRVKLLAIGHHRAVPPGFSPGGTSAAVSGTLNTSGGYVDLLAGDLFVAHGQTNNSGTTTGVLTLDQGIVDADNLYVAYHPSPAAISGATISFNAIGTVNVNGNAMLSVNNDLLLARKAGTNIPVATVNVAPGATVNVKGNVLTGGGTSTLNLNGTLNLQPAGDATPGNVTVGTLTGSGAIANAANVTNTTALTPGTANTAGTLTVGGNLTLPGSAALNFNFADTTTVGGNVNDLLSVSGDLTLNNNPLLGVPLAAALANGAYRVVDCGGTLTGTLNFTNPTRYALSLDYATAHQINLVNAGGGPASLTWNGSANGNWVALGATNWNNNTEPFYQLDSVTFDDSGVATNVALVSTLYPAAVAVNATTDYFFTGGGRISGAASLSKSGSGTLFMTNTGANDFTGPVTVNGGILKLGRSDSLGTTNSGTTVVSGGTLDINGISIYSPGEPVTIAGTGLNDAGAIINTGAGQNNALRFLTLSDNAAIRSDNRFDVRGPAGNSSFSGGLDLAGFTLTKLGAAQFSLADVVATNAGSIEVQGGTFAVTRSLLEGPGTITLLTNVLQIENATTGSITKPIIAGGGTIRVVNNSFLLAAPVTNESGVVFDVTPAAPVLTLTNVISGAGALTKINPGTLVLDAPNTYAGPTTISGGSLILSTNGSIAASAGIAVNSGVFDVSAVPGGFALSSGQTLSGSGAVIGDVVAGAGTGVVPGTSAGTLTFSNQLTMDSASSVFELAADPAQVGNNINDLVLVNSNLTLSGINSIKIVPLAVLNNASPYTLFQYLGTLTGGAANLSVSSDSRYGFVVVDPVTTPGFIQVNVSGSGASASLLWKGGAAANPTVWDTKTTANWLNGVTPDIFYLGDNVTFDDGATTTAVTLADTVRPASVLMKNSAVNYIFTGAGSLLAGSLTNAGPGTLTLANSAPNTIAGVTAVDGGAVAFANSAGNGFALGAVVNGGTLTFANAGDNPFGQVLALNAGTVIFDQPANAAFAGQLADDGAGSGLLEKRGGNVLTLSGDSTNFNGQILVSAGMLRATRATALGWNTRGTTVASGATFDVAGVSLYNPGEEFTISGAGLNSTGAVINTGAAQNNAIAAVTLAADATIAAWGNRWDIRGPGGSGSLSGKLDLGGHTLTKLGPGQISIVDASVFNAGVIDVVGGTLAVTRSSVPAAGYVNLAANVLVFDNYSAHGFSMPVTVDGGIIRLIGSPAFTFDSLITNRAGGLTFDNNTTLNLTAAGSIQGPGSLSKTGTGPVVLASVENAWGGNTVIAGGTLQIGTGAADGSLADLPITNNGTLIFSSLNSFALTQPISGSGRLQHTVGGTVTLTGANSYSGPTVLNTLTTTSPSGGTLRIGNSSALGDTTGNTTINGNTTGNSTLELAGNITVPEAFSLSARQTPTTDLPHIRSVSGNNTLTGNITGTTGGSQYNIQSDSGKLTLAGNFVPPSTAGTRLLKLMGAGDGEWSGIISNSLDTLVPALVAKLGSGTWTLSGSNVYRGSTTIREGTLALGAGGSINSSPTIDVQTNATFNVAAVAGGYVLDADQTVMGEGTVVGSVAANGTVAPGAAIGTLTFSNGLVLAGTTVMEIDRTNTPNADLIVAGALTYGGTLVVTNIGEPLQADDTFDLFNAPSPAGAFASTVLPALDPGLRWDTSALAGAGIIKVAAGLPTTPTNITYVVVGNTLELSWPADYTGYRLEGQTNALNVGLSATWHLVPDSTTTNRVILPIDPANGTAFYRLVSP